MSRRLKIGAAIVAALICAAGWWWFDRESAVARAVPAKPAAIPVQAASASRADVPVYLRGLGTVQAFNTVTVHARVDGELQVVAYTEGQIVKEGDLLAQIDPRPFQAQLDQAVAVKAQDEAKLVNAKLDLERFTHLAVQEFATRQSVDTQRALVRQFEATIKADQAMIDNARVQLGYTTIRSPITGRTGLRLVDVGNIVHANDTTGLVVITQFQPIAAIFTLPEDTVPALSRGLAAGKLVATAFSRDGKDVLDTGEVSLLDNRIDPATGTIHVKATFPNLANTLWPGQYINVRVLMRTVHNAITVPSLALQRGPNGMYAYVVQADNTVVQRPLDVGQIDGGVAIVKDGLHDGERVVTAGHYRLETGATVEVRAPPPEDTAKLQQ